MSSAPGGTVSISCRTSQDTYGGISLSWFQQKDGEAPKLLFYAGSLPETGVPERFAGSGSDSDFTLTITGVRGEDAAVYYCMSGHEINSQLLFTR